MTARSVLHYTLGAIALVAAATAFPAASHAITFDLTSNHCTDAAGCGAPGTIFGTVTLTQIGPADGTGSVDVTVHLNSPYAFAKTGSADFQAFKFNATGVVLGDITVNQTVPGQTLAAQTGAFNGDGTGPFSFGIACTTCGNGLSDAFTNDIVFHVANATVADLTAPNAPPPNGNVFVADIGNLTTGNTGPVAAVPGPVLGTGLPGLVMACGGLIALARRRRQKIV